MKSVVIIGGGLGGLFTGAILAKEGMQVTVLEKNATIGGGLQTFRRFGCVFDTGMHVIGGMQPGGNIWRICRYLGILDKVRLRDVDDDCTDRLYFAEDRQSYRIAKGREGFVRSLAAYFPEEEANLRRYVEDVFRLSEEVDLFYLRPARTDMFGHSEMFMMAADDFIAQHVGDPKLRSVLAYMNPLYGGRGQQTPAYVHAIISTLYINGASRFVGGSSHFADALAEVIEANGGRVIPGDGVEWIEVNDRHVDYVRTKKGLRYEADHYISDIHPCTLMQLMDEHAFPKSYRDRLNEIPNAYSAFSLYIKMKPRRFPYINHSEYFMTRYADVWNFGREDKPWPMGFLLMTPPEEQQGEWSEKVLITAPMTFDKVRPWEQSTVGRRGEDYERWKAQRTQELLALVEEMHPGFSEAIEAVNASSPLTIRDFYGAKEGTICGFSKDFRNIVRSQVPVVTKVRNLLLTGQNNNLHGFCGVPLTAINTCEALLGLNHVIDKVNRLVKVIAILLFTIHYSLFPASAQQMLTPYPVEGSRQPAVIVCPGGSYFWHDIHTEGHDVARWLQQQGIPAFVLRYRTAYVPAFIFHYRSIVRGNRYPDPQDDLLEALRYVRAHADEYGIDGSRVGVMGFSAGGHLAMSAVELFDRAEWPAFVVSVYPVVTMMEPYVHKRSRRGLLGESKVRNQAMRDSLSLERHVPSDCPPVFLVNCKDDPIVDYHNAVLLDSALTAQNVPHTYLQYQTGGHGFGVSDVKGSPECRPWRDAFLRWLKEICIMH